MRTTTFVTVIYATVEMGQTGEPLGFLAGLVLTGVELGKRLGEL